MRMRLPFLQPVMPDSRGRDGEGEGARDRAECGREGQKGGARRAECGREGQKGGARRADCGREGQK
eukprot:134317-Chlamydomonas_euryale.AAC.2